MAQSARVPARRRALVELLRPANVVTSLADVLAGYAVSGLAVADDLAWLLAATACLYAGGVVLNDVFDRHIDAVERPERPIPSGRISTRTAAAVGATLLALGIATAAMAGRVPAMMAAGVAVAVLLYDTWGKHQTFVGPLNMGLCRALNLLLGISAVPAALAAHWTLGLLPLVYIAAVTIVSRGEVHGGRRPVAVLALILAAGVVTALAGLSLATLANPPAGTVAFAGILLTGILAWRVLPAFMKGARTPDPLTLRRAVRAGVLSLVYVDAVIASVHADIIYCLMILLTGLIASRLARLFAVT